MNDNEDVLQSCCRICLDIESYHIRVLEDDSLQQKLDACLAIKISDSDQLPKVVCINCVCKLNEFYNFLMNSKICHDWLISQVNTVPCKKNVTEIKSIQPIADSEYNSDSLLEFLNTTDNVEDYLNTLGTSDVGLQSFVGLLDQDRIENEGKLLNTLSVSKCISPLKVSNTSLIKNIDENNMEIDFLESEADIVNELLNKEKPNIAHVTTQKLQSQIKSCLACKQVFETTDLLSKHLLVCDSTPRTCFHCGLQFDSKRQMLIHRLTHSIGPDATCESCGQWCADRKLLLKHYSKCHIDFVKSMGCSYHCKICDQLFHDRNELFKHAKKHIPSKTWYCDSCGRSYGTKAYLEAHKQKKHNDGTLYRCKVCGFQANAWNKLIVHVKKHSSMLDLERHLCDSCGQSFPNKATLNRHVLLHVGDRYKCRHCQKECVDELALSKHLALHERESAMCEFCGATFLKHDFLFQHLKTQHLLNLEK